MSLRSLESRLSRVERAIPPPPPPHVTPDDFRARLNICAIMAIAVFGRPSDPTDMEAAWKRVREAVVAPSNESFYWWLPDKDKFWLKDSWPRNEVSENEVPPRQALSDPIIAGLAAVRVAEFDPELGMAQYYKRDRCNALYGSDYWWHNDVINTQLFPGISMSVLDSTPAWLHAAAGCNRSRTILGWPTRPDTEDSTATWPDLPGVDLSVEDEQFWQHMIEFRGMGGQFGMADREAILWDKESHVLSDLLGALDDRWSSHPQQVWRT